MPTPLSDLLLPELEAELARTRRVLAAVPGHRGDFQSHPRSRTLASLAGHTADLVTFIESALTLPEFDFGTDHRTPLTMQSSAQLLSAFDTAAARTLAALRATSDDAFHQPFRFLFNGRVVFAGQRYTAYRINTLNHLLHHRSQLAVYLRLLELPVPALYGPSADESPSY